MSKADPEPEPEAEPEPETDAAVTPVNAPEPDTSVDRADEARSLEARIAVLEALRIETETFQDKLKEAIATAASQAEGGREAKAKLAEAEARLAKLAASKTRLLETAQDARARLTAVEEESRDLKQQVIDLKTRLAKANAQIESSESIIAELEGASKMAIELNADYRASTKDASAENRALRSRIGLLETAVSEREELLQSTNQTNEEISRALLDERVERAAIEEDFSALSKDFEILQQSSTAGLKRANMQAGQAEQELEAARETIASLEGELVRAYDEHKQMQLDQHAKQSENARLRVDYGVRTRLLENNLQELSAHIEALEQQLLDNGIPVPPLNLTPIATSSIDEELPPEPDRSEAPDALTAHQRGDVVRFKAKS
ncbi:MAG: hypothetical protein HKN11_17230 [Rhizobiales bacterium]|nr:hypothetical protein [Hyphomicrobiales bacterium]